MSKGSQTTRLCPTSSRLIPDRATGVGLVSIGTLTKGYRAEEPRRFAVPFPDLILFVALFVIVVAIQIAVGAYQGERSNQPDEASHFMNALLIRDYLTHGLGQSPLRFAEEYYLSYPKIAPGMWPPFFHVLLGLFMLPGWPPQAAALVLLALVGTWSARRLYRIVRLSAPPVVAFGVAAAFVSTPIIADLTSAVMLDLVVAALALEATYWLVRFFQTENWQDGALFGLLTALCCLTKGNGVSMVLVPPLLILFTRQFSILRRAGLYVAAAIVIVLAVPFLAISYRLDAAIGDFQQINADDILFRISFYSTFLVRQLGMLLLIAASVGLITTLYSRRHNQDSVSQTIGPALTALVVAAAIFHLLNPHRGIEGRYIALTIAPLLALVPLGIGRVSAALMRSSQRRAALQIGIVAVLFVAFFISKPAMATRRPLGCREAVGFLETQGGLAGRRVLVASDEMGEGACVSEVAVRHVTPSATVIRGSKLVASDDWGGRNFRLLHDSADALLEDLEDLHVDYVIVDYSPRAIATPYWSQVGELVRTQEDRIEAIHSINSSRRLVIYRLKHHSPGPPRKLRIALDYSLGRVLER
jgi:dolichyl-phosphate-mannose-protein mannosyltransferase